MARLFGIVLVCGILAPPVAAQTREPAMRFAGMDVNNDGVITRREWRGSTRAFEIQDWNGDGILSGEEVRPGANRSDRTEQRPSSTPPATTGSFDDWTARGFTGLDHDRNGRITGDEWHFDRESFRRADQNSDGSLSRSEFLGEERDAIESDQRSPYADTNNDGRISRGEWRGTAERFDLLDENRDGQLTQRELTGRNGPPLDAFAEADANRDGVISRDEWRGSPDGFDRRDGNRDDRLTRQEFAEAVNPAQTEAWRQGHERGLLEGRQAGKEDRERNQGWDLEGQRELETADSGYQARFGSRPEYQNGYREGFRRGYREGWGPR